jgi:type I restriction enzyme M protein
MSRYSPGQVLAALPRARLLELAEGIELRLEDRRRKAKILKGFDRISIETLESLLEKLSPGELRMLCQARSLNQAGHPDRLRARLLGRKSQRRPVRHPPHEFTDSGPESTPPTSHTADEPGTLALGLLGSHLWAAANILRGTIDSSDYRPYIVGLLFYKRLSDVWEEEQETGDDAEEEHRFQISPKLLWRNVCRPLDQALGERLNKAVEAITKANQRIAGLYQDIDFAHRDRFPNTTLVQLVRHFEKHRLRNSDVPADLLGNAYEYLIARFADDAGKKGGEFYTPKEVVRLLVELVDPRGGMTVYDPACGSGGMLLEAAAHAKKANPQDPRPPALFGQERNLNTWGICEMNLLLHGIDHADVKCGDTLREPLHFDPKGRLKKFDRVLANPPFSLKAWGHELWGGGDQHGRDLYGCPPQSYGDLAFVQHMIASLAPGGKLGVVLPLGVLFRGGTEGRIRRGMVEDDIVEAVIRLAPNLFYGTGIPACLCIINLAKPEARQGRVLFVDGSREFQTGKNQNVLGPENVERLHSAFKGYRDVPGLCRVATLEEIAETGHSLSVQQYVATETRETQEDLEQVLTEMQALDHEARELDRELHSRLEALGLLG